VYALVSLLTAGAVVGVTLGARAFLERARAKLAASAGTATVTSTAPSGSPPSAPSPQPPPASAASSGGSPSASFGAGPLPSALDADAGGAPRPFDTDAAHTALEAVAGSSDCKIPKTKPCRVKVTFGPDGGVTSAVALAPYVGTPQGACLAKRLREARVPAFVGAPVTLTFPPPAPK
jgi:hypothetical protein